MILRVFWKVVGERVRLRVFAAITQSETFREVGMMVMTGEEFLDLSHAPIQSEMFEEDDDLDQPARAQ